MNILFLTFYYPPDLCAGSFRSSAIVKALKLCLNDDDRLFVVTTLPNRYKTYSVNAEKYIEDGNIIVHRLPVREHRSGFLDQSITFFCFARQALTIAKEVDPDIVVATTSRFMTGLLGAYISIKSKSKYFIDIRDIFSETITELFSRKSNHLSKLFCYIFSRLERYVITRADKVNVVSESFKEYYSLKGFNTMNWLFYPNGVDEDFVQQYQDSFNRHESTIKVLYAGNIGEGQGLERVLPECAFILRDTHEFYVIGDGGAKDALQHKIFEAGIENIKIINPVARNELIKQYQKADILFLHLNDYQAFKRVLPSKIFEYVAMGKPIVAGVAGYASCFLNKNVPHAVVFEPCDVNACIAAIMKAREINVSRSNVDLFVEQYGRENISHKIAFEIYDLCSTRLTH